MWPTNWLRFYSKYRLVVLEVRWLLQKLYFIDYGYEDLTATLNIHICNYASESRNCCVHFSRTCTPNLYGLCTLKKTTRLPVAESAESAGCRTLSSSLIAVIDCKHVIVACTRMAIVHVRKTYGHLTFLIRYIILNL
ncbi:hypothetical protein PUN28_016221 [Cardiocondyla obscurior]|uniref:Uncharacterized protein n=1 Tax=Cardiocondyla obscurior TaxID=286306 RepID=A0AAW2EU12_9HYME